MLCAAFLARPAAAESAPARWSQLADTAFQNFARDSGLPSPIATALAEDGDGFLWIGTQAGLVRWDGYRFRTYKSDPTNPRGLPDNFIQSLHTDAGGRLWIGTTVDGMARYDRATDSFRTLPVGPSGTSHVDIHVIIDDGAGGLLVGTDGGLDHVSADGVRVSQSHHVEGDPASPPGDRVESLLRDHLGALWLGTPSGLFRQSAEGAPFQRIALPVHGQQPLVGALFEDNRGTVWIGTRGQGVFLLRADATQARAAGGADPDSVALKGERISAIEATPDGQIWIGTSANGVMMCDPAGQHVRAVRHDIALANSLPNNSVWALLRQKSGLIWVASAGGLSRFDPRQSAVISVFGASSRKESISEADMTSILALPDGKIWLGLASNGVDIIDPQRERVGSLRPGPGKPESTLAADAVVALARVANGDVYLGTARGLYRVREDGKGLTRVALTRQNPAAGVDVLYFDGTDLWMGSTADGIWQLGAESKGVTRVIRHLPSERLSDRRIGAIERGQGGNVWIGTGKGLNRYDPATDSVENILPDPADPHGLPNALIDSMATDRQGRLWLTTFGAGMAVLEDHPGFGAVRFRRFSADDGLPDNNVDAILVDRSGMIWASTDDGIAQIDPASLAVRALRREDGVQIPAYWTGSAAATPEGELLFGGGGGLTVIRPDRVSNWDYRPPLAITEARQGNSVVPANRFNGGGTGMPLVVQPKANSLSVEFAALDFTAPERNRYKYRLDGYDPDWIETDAIHRIAAYTNLPPGSYVLRLRGSNRDGIWSEQELRVPVTVQAAWYQTWGFRILAAVTMLGLVFAIVQTRTAYLRRVQRDLEAKVAERTSRLQAAMQALEEASLTDPLTGLKNRRFVTLNLEQDVSLHLRLHDDGAAAGRLPQDADMVFFMLDIDHFKQINDRFGHTCGDLVLIEMRERLRRVFRESDYLIRWGGEEFLVVARAASREHAESLAERVRTSMAEEEFKLEDGKTLVVTCSVGFASLPFFFDGPRALSWHDVVDLADIGLYIAKRAGRNCWVGLIANQQHASPGFMREVKEDPHDLVRRGVLTLRSNLDLKKLLGALPLVSRN